MVYVIYDYHENKDYLKNIRYLLSIMISSEKTQVVLNVRVCVYEL